MFAGLREKNPAVSANSVLVRDCDGFVEVAHFNDAQDRAENFFARDPAYSAVTFVKIVGGMKNPFFGTSLCWISESRFRFSDLDVF